MFLQALVLVVPSFQYRRSKVLICGKNDEILVFWKGGKKQAWPSRQVVLSVLAEKVPSDGFGDFSLEVEERLFNGWVGPWWVPSTGDI